MENFSQLAHNVTSKDFTGSQVPKLAVSTGGYKLRITRRAEKKLRNAVVCFFFFKSLAKQGFRNVCANTTKFRHPLEPD